MLRNIKNDAFSKVKNLKEDWQSVSGKDDDTAWNVNKRDVQ